MQMNSRAGRQACSRQALAVSIGDRLALPARRGICHTLKTLHIRGLPAVLTLAALLLVATSLPTLHLAAGDASAKSNKKKTGLSVPGPDLAGDPSDPNSIGLGGTLGVAPWLDIINQAATDAQTPWQVLAAIMAIESGGNPNAVSAAGAVGLMQLVPAYWESLSHIYGDNIWDPYTNIRTAAHILVSEHDRWGSWDQAAAAYFGALDGQGVITNARDAYGTSGQQYVERFRITLAAFGMGQSLAGLGDGGAAPASEAIGLGLAFALQQQGVPYVWGGAAPAEGFDCSGLIYWAYAQAGLTLPRTSAEMWHWTERVSAAEALPGDLVFFAGTNGPDISHVAIYAGAGLLLNAPNVGENVTLEPLNDPYWQMHLAGFGRVDPNYTPADGMLPIAIDPAPSTDPPTITAAQPFPIVSTPTPAAPQPAPITTPEPTPTQPPTTVTATPEPVTPTATEPAPAPSTTPTDTPPVDATPTGVAPTETVAAPANTATETPAAVASAVPVETTPATTP